MLFSIQKIKTRRYPCHKQELIHSLYSLFQNLLFAPYFLSADGGLIEWHSGRPLDFNPIPKAILFLKFRSVFAFFFHGALFIWKRPTEVRMCLSMQLRRSADSPLLRMLNFAGGRIAGRRKLHME